jgi:thiol-disulfide isomerase/thioredoxin/WD40 repeat protein
VALAVALGLLLAHRGITAAPSAPNWNAVADSSRITQIAYSSNGRYLVTAGATSVKIWDAVSGKLLRQIVCRTSGPGLVRFSLSADSAILLTDAVSEGQDVLKLWKPADGKSIGVVTTDLPLAPTEDEGPSPHVAQAVLLPDGRDVLGVFGGDRLVVYDAQTGAVQASVTVGADPMGHPAIVDAAGSTATVHWELSPQIETFHLPDLRPIGTIDGPEQGKGIDPSISPDGRFVALPISDGSVRIYAADGTLLRTLNNRELTPSVSFSLDGRTIASGGPAYAVRLWSVDTGQPSGSPGLTEADEHKLGLDGPGHFSCLALSPSAGTAAVVVGLTNSRVVLVDAAASRVRISLSDPSLSLDTEPIRAGGVVASDTGGTSASVQPAPSPAPASNTMAPDFTVDDPSGNPVSLSEFRGHVVVIDFWATWCAPCQRSLPAVNHVAWDYGSKGVVVLGVNTSDTKQAFLDWLPGHHNLSSIRFVCDSQSTAGQLYGITAIPTDVIVDRGGRIFATDVAPAEDTLRYDLDRAVATR